MTTELQLVGANKITTQFDGNPPIKGAPPNCLDDDCHVGLPHPATHLCEIVSPGTRRLVATTVCEQRMFDLPADTFVFGEFYGRNINFASDAAREKVYTVQWKHKRKSAYAVP